MAVNEIFTFEDLENAFAESDIVVLDIYATWCNPCKVISPYFDQLAQQYSSKIIKFYKYDCAGDQDLAHRLDVTSVPTFIVFEDREVKERLSGANKGNLKALIERYIE